jgi:hypothetical protein
MVCPTIIFGFCSMRATVDELDLYKTCTKIIQTEVSVIYRSEAEADITLTEV